MQCRRAIVPSGTFFFTLMTDLRRPVLDSDEAIDVLRKAFRFVPKSRPFEIDAIVVMPNTTRLRKGKYGLVRSPMEWPHVCFGRYVKAGVYPLDWGSKLVCGDAGGSEVGTIRECRVTLR